MRKRQSIKQRKPLKGVPDEQAAIRIQNTSSNAYVKVLGVTVLGVVTGIGAFLFVDKMIKKVEQNVTSRKSLVEGNPASYAAKLYKALDLSSWWSEPDKAMVFQVLRLIPAKLIEMVKTSYQKAYNRDLSKDLQKYLTAEEFDEAQRIISQEA